MKSKAKLESAGWRVGTAAEFVGMDDAEAKALQLRLDVAAAVRRLREALSLTQAQLAERIGSSQPRVANVEMASRGVSLDLAFRALFALGGSVPKIAGRRKTVGA